LLAGLAALGEFAVTAYIPAITIIADGLGVQTEIVQTTVSVGLVTGALAGLAIGAVADSVGRRQLLFPALGLYIVGSIFAAGRRRQRGNHVESRNRPRSPFRPAVNALAEWRDTGFFIGPGSRSPFWRASCCMAWMASDLRIRGQLRVRCICRHASPSAGNEKGAGCADKDQSNLRYL
jgi:hypothetical protein